MRYLTFVLLFPLVALSAQDPGELLEAYESGFHTEKIYIAHDKPFYMPGDTIWAQLFLVDGRSHRFFEAGPIVYVDWIGPTGATVLSYTLKIKDGLAPFEIPTNFQAEPGNYQLRAYTQYQRNFPQEFQFHKTIPLKLSLENEVTQKSLQDFSIQLFPEGGYTIENMVNRMTFKALDQDGYPIETNGSIQAIGSDWSMNFQSVYDGMGSFEFTPQTGVSYRATFSSQGMSKTFDLEPPLKSGFTLRVDPAKQGKLQVSVKASTNKSLVGASLVAHCRGRVLVTFDFEDKPAYQLDLPAKDIPSGIIHFTLFNAQKRPVAERLVFHENAEEQVQLKMTGLVENYDYQSLVDFQIQAALNSGDEVTKAALSVYNRTLFSPEISARTIQSYLWLESDLKGTVFNPGAYFNPEDSSRFEKLDLLMRTQAWRRFSWLKVIFEEKFRASYPTEESLVIAGQILRPGTKKPEKADVFLSLIGKDQFASLNVTTEEDGLFFFKGFDFRDTTSIVIQASIFNEKKRRKKLKVGELKRIGNKNTIIDLLELEPLPVLEIPEIRFNQRKNHQGFAENISRIRTVEAAYSGLLQYEIEAVTVKGRRLSKNQIREQELRKKYYDRGMFYLGTTRKLYMDDLPNQGREFFDIYSVLQSRLAGVDVRNTNEGKRIFIRGGASPALVAVNGFVTPYDFVDVLLPEQIEAFDIIQGTYATTLYGKEAAPGVVSILTRDSLSRAEVINNRVPEGTKVIEHPGLYQAREFYVPPFPPVDALDNKPDLRTTLFWEPNLQLNQNPVQVKFSTSEQAGFYSIKIEGITEAGIPFAHAQDFWVGPREGKE